MPPSIPSVFLASSSPRSGSSISSGSGSRGVASTSSTMSSGAATRRLRRPRTIAELAQLGEAAAAAMPFSTTIPVHRYLAGSENLLRQADLCAQTSSQLIAARRSSGGGKTVDVSLEWSALQEEWIACIKAARLLVDILPAKHPGWKKLDASTRAKAKASAEATLDRIGRLKMRANDLFEEWRAAYPDAPIDDDPEETQEEAPESRQKRRQGSTSPDAAARSAAAAAAQQQPQQPVGGKKSGGGFDVRDLLGISPFTSSPLERFSGSHSRVTMPTPAPFGGASSTAATAAQPSAKRDAAMQAALTAAASGSSGSGAGASGGSGRYTYPTLKPANTYRMSAHQATQGFAASSRVAGNYYSTSTIASSSSSTPSSSAPAPSPSAQQRPPAIPSRYEIKPPAAIPSPAPAPAPGGMGALRTGLPHEASLRNLHAYQKSPSPIPSNWNKGGTVETLARSPSRMALEMQRILREERQEQRSTSVPVQRAERPRERKEPRRPTARTEGGAVLRHLSVPAEIIDRFVAIAYPNTAANKETCALLMGTTRSFPVDDGRPTEEAEELVVTHLTIPKQTATADTCSTENEEELWVFQEERNLITLGWIHTHPTQTCFMSSLDLHTQASWQAMLPEAIAIVCAPNDDPCFGLFRLTDPTGVRRIVDCREPGTFHPHVDPDGRNTPALYTDAWGHVELDAKRPLEVVDLRSSK